MAPGHLFLFAHVHGWFHKSTVMQGQFATEWTTPIRALSSGHEEGGMAGGPYGGHDRAGCGDELWERRVNG